MKIELGKCPYCNSEDYKRGEGWMGADSYILNCECNACNRLFTEYYGLDEIRFERNNQEIFYNKTLSCDEKDFIVKMLLKEIKKSEKVLSVEDCQTFKKEVRKMINIMKGGLKKDD